MSASIKDVLIVGGGILGLTTAYELIKRNSYVNVTILDKSQTLSGASFYAGALDVPYFSTPYHHDLVEYSWDWYQKEATLSKHRWKIPILWAVPRTTTKNEFEKKLIKPIRQVDSNGDAHSSDSDFYLGESYVIDPISWCEELRSRLLESKRVTLKPGVEVLDILTEDDRVRIETNHYGFFFAKHIIICAGPWIKKLTPEVSDFTDALKVKVKQVSSIHINIKTTQKMALAFPERDIFIFPKFNSSTHVFSFRFDKWNVEPSQEQILSEEGQRQADALLNEIIGKENWERTQEKIFMDTYIDTFAPIVSYLPNSNNMISIVTGTHGSGVRLSPGLASVVSNLCLTSLNSVLTI